MFFLEILRVYCKLGAFAFPVGAIGQSPLVVQSGMTRAGD